MSGISKSAPRRPFVLGCFLPDGMDIEDADSWDLQGAMRKAGDYYGWGRRVISARRLKRVEDHGAAYDVYRAATHRAAWERDAQHPLTLDEFSEQRERKTKRGRPRVGVRLTDSQVVVARLLIELSGLTDAKAAICMGISKSGLSSALHPVAKKRTRVPDPGAFIERLVLALSGVNLSHPVPSFSLLPWRFSDLLYRQRERVLDLDPQRAQPGEKQLGHDGAGVELFPRDGTAWSPEAPWEEKPRPDRLKLFFDVVDRTALTRRLRTLGTVKADHRAGPRGNHRYHLTIDGIGHLSWEPPARSAKNVSFMSMVFFSKALSDGSGARFFQDELLPFIDDESLKIGRRDTAFDYETAQPSAPFLLLYRPEVRKERFETCQKKRPDLARVVWNQEQGSKGSGIFHVLYDKDRERLDRGRPPLGVKRGVTRVEVRDRRLEGDRHPQSFAFGSSNPSSGTMLIDIREALGEPYALVLLMASRLFGTHRVRRIIREIAARQLCGGTASSRKNGRVKAVVAEFDGMLVHFRDATRFTQPEEMYERGRHVWSKLLEEITVRPIPLADPLMEEWWHEEIAREKWKSGFACAT